MATETLPTQQPPTLPARRSNTSAAAAATTRPSALATTYTGAKTPASWLQWFEEQHHLGNFPHHHIFALPIYPELTPLSSGASAPTNNSGSTDPVPDASDPQAPQASAIDEQPLTSSLKEDAPAVPAKPAEPSEPTESYPFPPHDHDPSSITVVCRICRRWFTLTVSHAASAATSDGTLFSKTCTGLKYPTHHLHSTYDGSTFTCCGCPYILVLTTEAPVISAQVYEDLKRNRKESTSFASVAAGTGAQAVTVTKALETMTTYVTNALKGDRRQINVNNEKFRQRVGFDKACIALFNSLNFTLSDEHFHPPSLTTATAALLHRGFNELNLLLAEIQIRLAPAASPPSANTTSHLPAAKSLTDLLGNIYPSRPLTTIHSSTRLVPCYITLGVIPDMADEVIVWAYHILKRENPAREGELIDTLAEIVRETGSGTLELEAAMERSKGVVGEKDLREAYDHFGIPTGSREGGLLVDDTVILGVFDVKCNDEPSSISIHRDRLGIIAKARKSHRLKTFLKTGDRGGDGTGDGDVQMWEAETFSDSPVGLNNIGNTCYLNSLLQYYFTLRDLRETVLTMDQFVEDETDEAWQPKKVGGQTVDRREVQRAKTFVALLRSLFLDLTHTTHKSISPTQELAYMALTSTKDVEESERRAEKEREEEESRRQRNATDLPGPVDEENTSAKDRLVEQVIDDDQATLPLPETDLTQNDDTVPMPLSNQPEGVEIATSDSTLPPAYDENAGTILLETAAPVTGEDKVDEGLLLKPDDPNPHVDPAPVYGPQPPPGWTPAETAGGGSSSLGQDSTKMLFGRQQDVTECMDNAIYLLEVALKPLTLSDSREQLRDTVKDLFYGCTEQILTYRDLETDRLTTTSKVEDFSHLIVQAAEGRDLYDGLDEYFFADNLGDYQGGSEAVREVVIRSLPPVLQIQVQRVQFDRTTSNVYKSNAFLRLDKSIYLDRYLASNHVSLRDRRSEAKEWRKDMEIAKARVTQVMENARYPMPVPDMMEATLDLLRRRRHQSGPDGVDDDQFRQVEEMIEREARKVRDLVKDDQETLDNLRTRIKQQYDDLRECEYRIHAVFMHQGQANYGHYWIYIYDFEHERWWKYNDSIVTEVNESEVFADTTGSTANPYFVVYVRASDSRRLVNTVCRIKTE